MATLGRNFYGGIPMAITVLSRQISFVGWVIPSKKLEVVVTYWPVSYYEILFSVFLHFFYSFKHLFSAKGSFGSTKKRVFHGIAQKWKFSYFQSNEFPQIAVNFILLFWCNLGLDWDGRWKEIIVQYNGFGCKLVINKLMW